MPNWTFNTITLRGDTAKRDEFKKQVKGDDQEFDFNKIKPMPESLAIESGSRTGLGLACYDAKYFKEWSGFPWFPDSYPNVTTPKQLRMLLLEQEPEVVKLGKQAMNNLQQYGAPTWYEWCNKHWGTKWNACEIEVEEYGDTLTYRFDTAWDCPRPLVEPVIELAQELGLSVVWDADHEDGGYEAITDSNDAWLTAA